MWSIYFSVDLFFGEKIRREFPGVVSSAVFSLTCVIYMSPFVVPVCIISGLRQLIPVSAHVSAPVSAPGSDTILFTFQQNQHPRQTEMDDSLTSLNWLQNLSVNKFASPPPVEFSSPDKDRRTIGNIERPPAPLLTHQPLPQFPQHHQQQQQQQEQLHHLASPSQLAFKPEPQFEASSSPLETDFNFAAFPTPPSPPPPPPPLHCINSTATLLQQQQRYLQQQNTIQQQNPLQQLDLFNRWLGGHDVFVNPDSILPHVSAAIETEDLTGTDIMKTEVTTQPQQQQQSATTTSISMSGM